VVVLGYVYGNYKAGEIFYLGGLAALLGFVNQFTNAFTRIAQAYTDIVGYNTDVGTIKNIEDAYLLDHRKEGQGSLPGNWRTIKIDHLNFNYDRIRLTADNALADPVIHRHIRLSQPVQRHVGISDVHLHFKRGQKIALIGESGSGKSTLLALLRSLYLPLPGFALTVDDKLCEWTTMSDGVTLFPQQPEIFENTILHNITPGLPFSEQEILEICEVVCLADLINQLPQGLEANIQENGINLSIGQKQRLALARGVLASRSSSIVLLDEPTSSIDLQTEIEIHKRLFAAFADKLIISSLHGLHLLNLFDYGYVLHQGRIIEEGTPEELFNGDYLRSARAAVSS